MKTIEVQTGLYDDNDKVSSEVNLFLKNKGIKVINLLGSPGSGKTTLLEGLIREAGDASSFAVVEGDLYTDRDARRIAGLGVRTLQLNTCGSCHLEAHMIKDAVGELDLSGIKYLFIDNIGNLVCTSEFRIGEDIRIGVISVTEGNDKPEKYPLMFQTSDIIILNKTDILPYTDFSTDEFEHDVKALNPRALILQTCAVKNEGIRELWSVLK